MHYKNSSHCSITHSVLNYMHCEAFYLKVLYHYYTFIIASDIFSTSFGISFCFIDVTLIMRYNFRCFIVIFTLLLISLPTSDFLMLRQINAEGRPLTFLAFYNNFSITKLHDPFYKRKSKSVTLHSM